MSGRRPPAWVRPLLRIPGRLYAHGFGHLLGHRFLQLTHVGRRTGRRYRVVLEVLRYDPSRREAMVISGFGYGSDWLKNVEAGTSAEVSIGRESFDAHHRVLGVDEAARVIADYERRNRIVLPVVRYVLSRLAGWRYDGSPEARRRLVGQLPVIAFLPISERLSESR